MKIKVNVSTGYVGSRNEDIIEIDDEDLIGMTEEDKEKYIDEKAFEYICEMMIDWGWRKVD